MRKNNGTPKNGVTAIMRSLAGVLACVGLCLTAACGNASSQSTQEDEEQNRPSVIHAQEQARQLQKKTISLITVGRSGGFRAASQRDIRTQLSNAGYVFGPSISSNDTLEQMQTFESALNANPAVILLTPAQQTGWTGELKKARAQKIPVILVGRTIRPADTSLYRSVIGPSDQWAGRQAALYVNSLLQKPDLSTGDSLQQQPLRGFVIQGPLGDPQTNGRMRGWSAALSSRVNVVAQANGDWTRTSGRTITSTLLRQHRSDHVSFIFALNDAMALGAAQAVEQEGLRGKVHIVSIDATRAGLLGLINGDLDRVIEYNPLMGPEVMTTVTALLSGKKVSRTVVVPSKVFTAKSAKEVLEDRVY